MQIVPFTWELEEEFSLEFNQGVGLASQPPAVPLPASTASPHPNWGWGWPDPTHAGIRVPSLYYLIKGLSATMGWKDVMICASRK